MFLEDDKPKKPQGRCFKCQYFGESAFDGKCPRCGEAMSSSTDQQTGQQPDPGSQPNQKPGQQPQQQPAPNGGTAVCQNCQGGIPQGYGFCPACGTPVTKQESEDDGGHGPEDACDHCDRYATFRSVRDGKVSKWCGAHRNKFDSGGAEVKPVAKKNEDNMDDVKNVECTYCGLSFNESEEICPRCATPVTEYDTHPSGGEQAQASAPPSYSPGGPTGDIGIHSTCPGCGESTGASPNCPNCGYQTVEQDETWSEFVTERDAMEAAISLSLATMAEDDAEIIRIANELVFGDGVAGLDITPRDMSGEDISDVGEVDPLEIEI